MFDVHFGINRYGRLVIGNQRIETILILSLDLKRSVLRRSRSDD